MLEKINEGLAITKANGIYDLLYEKWFGLYEVKEVGLLDILKYLIPIVLLFLAIGGYFFYRRLVERKQAEMVLRESEERFHSIFEGTGDGIILVDTETKQLSSGNFAFCQMLGYSPEELTQLGVPDIHPKKDLPYVLEQFEKQMRGEIQLAKDIPVKCKDSSVLYADIKASPISLAGKHYLLGIFRDITERKQMDEKLQISMLKYQLLFEDSRDALMMQAPPTWKFTEVNEAALNLFGASSVAEFTELGPWDVAPEKQPDGQLSSEKAQEMIATAMREGSSFFEWEHQRLDGQTFAADVLLTRLDYGEGNLLQGTVRDISERKQMELQLEKMAITDGLTSLYNRVYFTARLEDELQRSARFKSPLSLLMVDIDFFKPINDAPLIGPFSQAPKICRAILGFASRGGSRSFSQSSRLS